MAKELPYFKFEPAEYLTKDISFCSLPAQGLFINVCSYYWQRGCKLTKDQLLRRLNHPKELQELIDENIISVNENDISVRFLDAQLLDATSTSKTNSINGSKGGRPKKEKPKETETKPKQNPNESETISETKGIREDKIREDKKKVDNILSSLQEPKLEIFNEWLKYRKEAKKEIKLESTLEKLVEKFNAESLEKCKFTVNNSIQNGYTGLFWDNYKPTSEPVRVTGMRVPNRFNE